MTDAPPDGELVSRVAARVLLIDAADRLLLMRGFDPGRPGQHYWFTVGGGLDVGETPLDAAVRELCEETGLKLPATALSGPVFHETAFFPFNGRRYSQEQDFFVARVDTWEVDRSGFDEVEQATVVEVRWWTLGELTLSTDQFYPANLVPLLRSALTPAALLTPDSAQPSDLALTSDHSLGVDSSHPSGSRLTSGRPLKADSGFGAPPSGLSPKPRAQAEDA